MELLQSLEGELSKLARKYSPFPRKLQIPLEASVIQYYEQMRGRSLFTSWPQLILRLESPNADNNDDLLKYSSHYSELQLDLSLPEVNDIHEMLNNGAKVRFTGTLNLSEHCIIPNSYFSRVLKGELHVNDKSYFVGFWMSTIPTSLLYYISKK